MDKENCKKICALLLIGPGLRLLVRDGILEWINKENCKKDSRFLDFLLIGPGLRPK